MIHTTENKIFQAQTVKYSTKHNHCMFVFTDRKAAVFVIYLPCDGPTARHAGLLLVHTHTYAQHYRLLQHLVNYLGQWKKVMFLLEVHR